MTRGRARQFDHHTVLDAAEAVFRSKGLAGAGVVELMAAMGLGAGSFYAAFKSKAELYEMVLDRAANADLDAARQALARGRLRAALTQLVHLFVDRMFDNELTGCIFILSGAHQWAKSAERWRMSRHQLRQAVDARCCQIDAGPAGHGISARIISILDAMAVQASSGVGREQVTELALSALDAELLSAGRSGNG